MEILTTTNPYHFRLPDSTVLRFELRDPQQLRIINRVVINSQIEIHQKERWSCCSARWVPVPPEPDLRSYVLDPRRSFRVVFGGDMIASISPFGRDGCCVTRLSELSIAMRLDSIAPLSFAK